MRQGLLKQLMWEDIQEIWFETDKTLHSEPVKAMATASERFSLALKNLREKNDCHPPIGERYPFVLSCAELSVGQPLANMRDKNNTIIRSFVSYQLHREGYSYTDIGRMMKRDHSTVIHLVRKTEDMLSLPQAYKQEVDMYNKMQELL